MRNLILFITAIYSTLQIANGAVDSRLNYQKDLSRMGGDPHTGKSRKSIRAEGSALLQEARKETNGISQQDYNFLKGTSAFAASGAEWAHSDGVTGTDVTILLLEDSGVNHADIRKKVEHGSPESAIPGDKYKLDHGSSMASLIHAIAPDSVIRVRPTKYTNPDLLNVRIINASFGDYKNRGFINNFANLKETNNVLIAKAAGNHQQNLSENPHTQDCESLLPFTIFTGNLRQDYKGKTSSGFPGANPAFQNSFLWVIADDVFVASGSDGSTEYSPKSGTSNAAAILSGAAALILSKHPTLNTADLKEILLESADRDIFQLFGSGNWTFHISDTSVDFYRKQTQYKKTNKNKSTLDFAEYLANSKPKEIDKNKSIIDFAEDLSNSNDLILAAEIVGGSRGISNRAPTENELEQFKSILTKLKESGNDTLESLSPNTAHSELEKKHREGIQDLLKKITTNASNASPTAKTKTPIYDPAFWGKGVLNIKNALIYAKLKMRYPGTSPHELRERMLKFINTQQQYTAMTIQKKLRSRVKATKEQKAAWDQRQGLTINTSLPDRKFDEMLPDPREKPSLADQTDEERLKDLGITLPETPIGKKLNTISGGASASATSSGPAREITPIADSDIPVDAPAELREFLKADSENLIKTFNDFSENTFKPLMDLAPEQIASRLLGLNLSKPFMANRVIYKDTSWSGDNYVFSQEKVTIIRLFHDYLRIQIGLEKLAENTETKAKITKIVIHLLTTSASDLEKQEILSLLKQYSEYGDTEVKDFIIKNDPLNINFINIETEGMQYNKKISSKRYTGLDIVQSWQLPGIMESNPSAQTKAALKRFFKTPAGRGVLARISIKEPIQEALSKQQPNLVFNGNIEALQESITSEGQRLLPTIFRNPQQHLPKLFSILGDYADQTDIPALITAIKDRDNQINLEVSTPGLTALVNGYLAATLPRVFE